MCTLILIYKLLFRVKISRIIFKENIDVHMAPIYNLYHFYGNEKCSYLVHSLVITNCVHNY